jgi:hypothetical protein
MDLLAFLCIYLLGSVFLKCPLSPIKHDKLFLVNSNLILKREDNEAKSGLAVVDY